MAPVVEACDECTSNCHVMHKRDKNPSPKASATTFFKVMIGDDFSKILYLPPRFTHSVRKKVGKITELENLNGEKFEVNIMKVDGGLAFQKGWSEFVSAHELKLGDLLVFHYIMDKHFVVLMYGKSGCPELRHYQMETKKNNTCDRFSHESSSQPKKRMKEKNINANMPNTHHQVFASSQPGTSGSDKEKTSQKSKRLSNNTKSDRGVSLADNDNGNVVNMVIETPVEKRSCLVDNDNGNIEDEHRKTDSKVNGNIEDERRKKDSKVKSVESGSTQKNSVGSGSGGVVEIKSNEFRKKLEKRILEKLKENTVIPREATRSTSLKRSRDVDVSDASIKITATHTKSAKKEHEASGSKLRNSGSLPASNGIFPRPEATHAKITKIDPDISAPRLHNGGRVSPSSRNFHKPEGASAKKEPDTSGSKLHNGGYPFTSTGFSSKPIAMPPEITKKEPVTLASNLHNGGYSSTPIGISPKPMGSNLEDTKIAHVNSRTKEFGNNLPEVKVKPEPVEDDDALPSSSINISFSAVMSSYQYLELPEYVKLGSVKSSVTVIFLKNGAHLWPVLYQTKLGLKALTQSWGTFAREKGIQLGDKCVFVPEKEPNVFTVHTTR